MQVVAVAVQMPLGAQLMVAALAVVVQVIHKVLDHRELPTQVAAAAVLLILIFLVLTIQLVAQAVVVF